MQEADAVFTKGGSQGAYHLGLGNAQPRGAVPVHYHFPLSGWR
jgi:hypothetical protein